jgi:hypothetical protein
MPHILRANMFPMHALLVGCLVNWIMAWTIYLFARFINRGDCLKATVMGRNPEGDVVVQRVEEKERKASTRW